MTPIFMPCWTRNGLNRSRNFRSAGVLPSFGASLTPFGAGLLTPPERLTEVSFPPEARECEDPVRRGSPDPAGVPDRRSPSLQRLPMERYRIRDDVGIYFLTMSVVEWLPVFVSGGACKILAESLNFCIERKSLRVNAYVIIPTHFHAIVFMSHFDVEGLKNALTDLRKFTGRRLIEYCQKHMPGCFDAVFVASAGEDRQRRFWQATVHPERIETEAFYRQKFDYLHDNPCRKGLVHAPDHWRFSSASYWQSERPIPNDVILSQLEW